MLRGLKEKNEPRAHPAAQQTVTSGSFLPPLARVSCKELKLQAHGCGFTVEIDCVLGHPGATLVGISVQPDLESGVQCFPGSEEEGRQSATLGQEWQLKRIAVGLLGGLAD